MAVIKTNTKSSLHTRCDSLPSAPHPLISRFEEPLQRLKGTEAPAPLSSSSETHKLDSLQDLHDCTDKLLQLPKEQQALAQECNNKWVDDLLEGSLRLLDICSKAKDCLMQSKESVHELQSIIRRRTFENLKAIKNETIASSANQENNNLSVRSLLKEAEEVTLSSLESLLLFISDSKGRSKQSRWSIVSKLVQPRRVACDCPESELNEFETVDTALHSLIAHKPSSIENFQCPMENLELCIQDLEIGVEQLSRKLIRNRVSLLNIFSHKS